MPATTGRPRTAPAASVHAVRRFNRFYTRHVGVLQEHLLGSRLSLTEVRVLYEIAQHDDVTAVEIRETLGLDRGYMSRILQQFAGRGWLRSRPSPEDRRRTLLSLTSQGRRAFAPLDRRSSDEVAKVLDDLSPLKRRDLLQGMRQIERILTPADDGEPGYVLRQHRPGDLGWVVHRHGILYSQEYGYDERFEALVADIVAQFVHHFDPKRDRCWIAERDGESVGSVFLVRSSRTVGKLRLLLVEPTARGLGIGRRLIAECITFAREAGYRKIVLWTQGELHAARRLYEQAGFRRATRERHQSWGRSLVAETWELSL
jgi:DNA-binding MarR family transcriptional regulator/N-acetylglutamate synthase-like GNAT family acetyltransferase